MHCNPGIMKDWWKGVLIYGSATHSFSLNLNLFVSRWTTTEHESNWYSVFCNGPFSSVLAVQLFQGLTEGPPFWQLREVALSRAPRKYWMANKYALITNFEMSEVSTKACINLRTSWTYHLFFAIAWIWAMIFIRSLWPNRWANLKS